MKYKLGIEFDPQRSNDMTNASLPGNNSNYCAICYDELAEENQFGLECRHTFCEACWSDYLSERVMESREGIDLLCMQQGCNLKVPHSAYEKFLGSKEDEREKYWRWLTMEYAEAHPHSIKKCPNYHCQMVC